VLNYDTYFNSSDWEERSYPDYFIKWDSATRRGKLPFGLITPDDLLNIITIYLEEDNVEKARYAIEYAFAVYGDDEVLSDILVMLNEYGLWNDLLTFCDRFRKEDESVENECHRLIALVHLGMEEEAFYLFGILKKKYGGTGDIEMLGMIYLAMSEALLDVDLYKSCDEVTIEAMRVLGEECDFLWIRLQCLVALRDRDTMHLVAGKIQKLCPFDAETWHDLGDAYKEIGDMGTAIDAYEFACSLGQDKGNLFDLIIAYNENGNYEKAFDRMTEYFERYEGSYMTYFTAARLCAQLERWADALYYINFAIEEEPAVDSLLYIYKSAFLVSLDELDGAKDAILEGLRNTEDSGGRLKEILTEMNKKFPQ
jgi:tetratricopeptide (TPR) repeat protein